MRTVVFVAPFFADTTLRFIRAAAENPETRLVLVSQDSRERLPRDLRSSLAAHLQVDDALSGQGITEAVRAVAERSEVHAILGVLEQLQVQLAEAREALGIPGMGVEAAQNFRDKARMKDVLREAGLPCARHRLIGTAEDAFAFAEEVGYPIVVKPPAGAGATHTHTVEDRETLEKILSANPPHPSSPTLGEEFIRGEEHSFDGVSIDGEVVWHSLTRYQPGPLEAMENPWIQWCILLPREVDDPRYDDVREAAAKSLTALGMETGICHLEWFRRGDGSLAISEVGARPGGVQISRLISYANDVDWYRCWAQVMIDGSFEAPERKYAVGAAFLRGQGQGNRVRAIHGLERAQEELGPLVVEASLPRIGQPHSSSYEGEGFVILRHRQTEVVERALHRLISTVRVELGS